MTIAPATFERRRFTSAEYYRMAEIGILRPDEHLELLDGRIWEMHPPKPRLFTVDEYYRMAEAGILGPTERVELINGEVIVMSPIGSRHQSVVDLLNELLSAALKNTVIIRVQGPIHVAEAFDPQPDLVLLRRREDRYRNAHPTPVDVLLLIEISDSTLAYDKKVKIPLYAQAGIPEVWIIDLESSNIVQHSQPANGKYGEVRQVNKEASVTAKTLPDLTLDVSAIFS